MRYTEKEYDYDYSSISDWFQHLVALLIVAPLRLFNEISTKIIYLRRELINKVLNLAVILNVVVILIYSGVHLWLHDFDFWKGKIPVALQLLSLITLVGVDAWYHFYNFVIYQHLSALLPIITSTQPEEDTAEQVAEMQEFEKPELQNNDRPSNVVEQADKPTTFDDFNDDILSELIDIDSLDLDDIIGDSNNTVSNAGDMDEIVSELLQQQSAEFNNTVNGVINKVPINNADGTCFDLTNVDKDVLAMLNEDLLNDADVAAYRHFTEQALNDMDAVEESSLRETMDSSEDPSKFVPEDNLFMFLQDLGADSFGTIDSFTGWNRPEGVEYS